MFLANLFIFSALILFDLWLTPADPCMTFDPSNALRSGQESFLPNLEAVEHS